MDIFSFLRHHQYIWILNKTWNTNKISKRTAVDVVHDIIGPKISDTQHHIIALHGLLGSKRNWKSLADKISDTTKASVITPDARNHGDSPHESTHTYFDLADDASRLQALKTSHIIGHSMGGRTGMLLALTQPVRVQSLIVVDISPAPKVARPLSAVFPQLFKAMMTVNFQGADSGHKARVIASETLGKAGFDKRGLGFILMSIGQRADKTFGWKYNLEVLYDHLPKIATFPEEMTGKQYEGPTLFIGGGQSDFVPRSDEPIIKSFFPSATLIYIEHVGHNAHTQDPPAFLKLVFEFYSKMLNKFLFCFVFVLY